MAISGSGPAYFFYLAESLAQTGAAQGLSEEEAIRLARQTLIGAGAMTAAQTEKTLTQTAPGRDQPRRRHRSND